MLKITNYKMTREQFEENAAHLERALWILNADRQLEGEDRREALQEIADVLENFKTVREYATSQTRTAADDYSDLYDTSVKTNWRDESNAPYLKPSSDKPIEMIGKIRI